MAGWPMLQSSGMRERGGVRDLEGHVVLVAPPPVLTRLVRLHDRVTGGVVVGGGVPAGRRVAAADVPAGHADPQVHPAAAGGEALDAAVAGRLDVPGAVEVGADFLGHAGVPSVASRSRYSGCRSR